MSRDLASVDADSPADGRPVLAVVLPIMHYIYPTAIFLYWLLATSLAICTLQTQHPGPGLVPRKPIQILTGAAILTYFCQLGTLLYTAFVAHGILAPQDAIVGLLACILVFGVQLAALTRTKNPVWYPYIGSFSLGLVFELAQEILRCVYHSRPLGTVAEVIDLVAVINRCLCFSLVLLLCVGANHLPRPQGRDAEEQPLLPKDDRVHGHTRDGQQASQDSGYGSTTATNSSQASSDTPESPWERRQREAKEKLDQRLKEQGNWLNYLKSFQIFLPYLWPVDNRILQLRAVLVGVCLLLNNLLHVLIPRQLGIVTDSLDERSSQNPWTQVLILIILKLAASEAGILLLQQWLWVPVEYYSFGAISTAAYSHVLNLSSDFHDTKSSSDVMMAIQSGQNVSNLLESICFQALPMLVDLGIAFVYLSATFGPYEGLITLTTAVVFLFIATRMLEGLKESRKSEVAAYFEEHYVRQAGIQGWSTVASFNQIGYEENRYSNAVSTRIARSQAVLIGYLLSYAAQCLVLFLGLLAGAFLAVYQVSTGQATPGQFIMLLTYWAQLVAPLSFFARLGKNLSSNLIHAEKLLEILTTKPSIVSKTGAEPLRLVSGHVKFGNVHFSYDDKKSILKDINFSVSPGTTVALVGPTGAGKSTILKLLDRFYDVTEGSVEIDGQDIRDVNVNSLRSHIGIVPQAPILFDDTIMNNIRYARLSASEDEVHRACEAACIHEQILGFTDGYDTRVGERGVKLSGGELQRMAIARAILKNPSIVLLDEATSAVDTETEEKIQEGLKALCRGRTTFVVAHRLSTVINADLIMVIAGGELIEQGSHDELLRREGRYATLWSKQIQAKTKQASEDTDGDGSTGLPDLLIDVAPAAADEQPAKVNSSANPKKSDSEEAEEQDQTYSHLNPDAPTFTPRMYAVVGSPATKTGEKSQKRGVLPSFDDASYQIKNEVTEGPTPAEDETPSPEAESSNASVEVQKVPKDQKENQPAVKAEALRDSEAATSKRATEASRTGSKSKGKSDKVRWRRPRYSRRLQSKSEPSASNGSSNQPS